MLSPLPTGKFSWDSNGGLNMSQWLVNLPLPKVLSQKSGLTKGLFTIDFLLIKPLFPKEGTLARVEGG